MAPSSGHELRMATEENPDYQPSPIPTMQSLDTVGGPSRGTQVTPEIRTITQAVANAELEATEEQRLEAEERNAYIKYQEIRELRKKKRKEAEQERVTIEEYKSSEEEGEIRGEVLAKNKAYTIFKARPPKEKVRTAEELEAIRYNQTLEQHNFRSPFTDDINEAPVPKGLKGPRIKMYDGTGDPDDHVHNFQWAIKMIPMDEKLWSLYFAGTLDKSARYWLDSLPPKSIGSFEELRRKFCNSFIQQKRYHTQSHAIFACRQRDGVSNKD